METSDINRNDDSVKIMVEKRECNRNGDTRPCYALDSSCRKELQVLM